MSGHCRDEIGGTWPAVQDEPGKIFTVEVNSSSSALLLSSLEMSDTHVYEP
jgi:hypothetical protein